MNERIQELRKQAMVSEAYYPAGNDGHPEYRSYLSEEKFAELIVRECAKVIDELEDAVVIYRLGGENTGEISKSELIKQHFGVEE
jgi:hypothetical protein